MLENIYSRYNRSRQVQRRSSLNKVYRATAEQIMDLAYGNPNLNYPTTRMVNTLIRGEYKVISSCNLNQDLTN